MRNRLFVSNLSTDTTEDRIAQVFGQDSRKVDRVAVVTHRDTGASRGFAFVEMATETDARSALAACNATELDGRTLRVTQVKERRTRSSDLEPVPAGNGPASARLES